MKHDIHPIQILNMMFYLRRVIDTTTEPNFLALCFQFFGDFKCEDTTT